MTDVQWISSWFSPKKDWLLPKEQWASLCVISAWQIWKARCIMVHQNKLIDPVIVMKQIAELMICYDNTSSSTPRLQKEDQTPTIWIPPCINYVKLNVDIRFLDANTRIGIGFILRDTNGKFAGAESCSSSACSSEEAEAKGIVEALSWALDKSVSNLILETDHLDTANYLNGKDSSVTSRSSTINSASMLFSCFSSVKVLFTGRSGNHAVHLIASKACISSMVPKHYSSPPLILLTQLKDDSLLCNIADEYYPAEPIGNSVIYNSWAFG
ncbi:hypothetical protein FRX31_016079 [Thalictrum thalictroides]|uniref:RNase H type-1 domain-containing protein n=1 Tax=Thalictrum thalictroides TaxID=46969 RepID=A0A7J6WBM0_THATH|nr:hypothetical protein FRX31_016079 [Thalictrum thalictroides]